MQLYKCVLRLNGSLHNEVPKNDVTAAEIQVLKAIHQGPETGVDAVVRIQPTRKVDRSDQEERARLQDLYGASVARNPRLRSLNDILGHPSVPLPRVVPGVAESEPEPSAGKRRGRKPAIKLTPTEEALLRRKEEAEAPEATDEGDTEIQQEEFA